MPAPSGLGDHDKNYWLSPEAAGGVSVADRVGLTALEPVKSF
jgi:hypothetical protein